MFLAFVYRDLFGRSRVIEDKVEKTKFGLGFGRGKRVNLEKLGSFWVLGSSNGGGKRLSATARPSESG